MYAHICIHFSCNHALIVYVLIGNILQEICKASQVAWVAAKFQIQNDFLFRIFILFGFCLLFFDWVFSYFVSLFFFIVCFVTGSDHVVSCWLRSLVGLKLIESCLLLIAEIKLQSNITRNIILGIDIMWSQKFDYFRLVSQNSQCHLMTNPIYNDLLHSWVVL